MEGAQVLPIAPEPQAVPASVPGSEVTEAPKQPSHLEVMARREKALVRRAQELKRKEQEIEALSSKYKGFESPDKVKESIINEFKANPARWLEATGMNLEDFNKYFLKDPAFGSEEVQSLKSEIANLKRYIEEKEQKSQTEFEARAQAAQQEAVETFNKDIETFTTRHAENYELINFYGAPARQRIYQLSEEYWNKHQRLLPIKEAADNVEKELEAQISGFVGLKKLQAKLGEKPQEKGFVSSAPKTLSHQMTASTPTIPLRTNAEQSAMARALAKLNGK